MSCLHDAGYPAISNILFKFFLNLFIYFWLCWLFPVACQFSLVSMSMVYSLVVVCGFLIAVASLVAEHEL